jgi:hypothetical protein
VHHYPVESTQESKANKTAEPTSCGVLVTTVRLTVRLGRDPETCGGSFLCPPIRGYPLIAALCPIFTESHAGSRCLELQAN